MWTSDSPTEGGWYWFKWNKPGLPSGMYEPMMVWVYPEEDGTLLLFDPLNQEDHAICDIPGLWSRVLPPSDVAYQRHTPDRGHDDCLVTTKTRHDG